MSTRRLALICTLLMLGFAACGDEPQPTIDDATDLLRTVPVRQFWSPRLLRGGVLDLFPDGRAVVDVPHLGGGTEWHGTWVETGWIETWPDSGKRLTIHLHRRQEQVLNTFSAAKTLDPPEVLILKEDGEDWWLEERRTFLSSMDEPLRWKFQGTYRKRRVDAERDFQFVTEAEFRERGGWEELPIPESSDK